ncbi:MAG: PspC domain-containing protein [Chloroflexi bacterium]|nr:PspC domain-containing protein [Chloroflexota bacterium]
MNPRRLYRCRHDRRLAGVAAGMAEYLELDPTLVRVLWILSVFLGGFTIVLYVILAFVIPLEPLGGPVPGSWPGAASPAGAAGAGAEPTWHAHAPVEREAGAPGGRGAFVLGILLVVFGAIALANVLFPAWVAAAALGPAFLVALGVALLVGATRRSPTAP